MLNDKERLLLYIVSYWLHKRIVFEGSTVSEGTRYPYEHPCKFLVDENE